MRTMFLAFVISALPLAAFSQAVVGTATVEGRQVELRDDFTWGYTDGTPPPNTQEGCFAGGPGITLCGADLGWKETRALSPMATGSFVMNTRTYGMIIAESLGTADGVSLDFMEMAVLENAALGSGTIPENIERFTTTEGTLAGRPSRTMTFKVDITGVSFVFDTTLIVEETRTTQFITYVIGQEPTDSSRKIHADFLAALQIE